MASRISEPSSSNSGFHSLVTSQSLDLKLGVFLVMGHGLSRVSIEYPLVRDVIENVCLFVSFSCRARYFNNDTLEGSVS